MTDYKDLTDGLRKFVASLDDYVEGSPAQVEHVLFWLDRFTMEFKQYQQHVGTLTCSRCHQHAAVTLRGGMPLCGSCKVEVEQAVEAYLRGAQEREPDYYVTSASEEAEFQRWAKERLLDPQDTETAVAYEEWFEDSHS